jgi:hypothetical protein
VFRRPDNAMQACQIASNPDPIFASNSDPLISWH